MGIWGKDGKMGKYGHNRDVEKMENWKTKSKKVKIKKISREKMGPFFGPGQHFWSLVLKSKEIAFLMKFDLRSLIFGVN